jgi:FkbM family methyltransferase
LVLDVGANFGYYSLMAASMGCNVVAWEPVPNYASFFKYALIRNHFLSKVQLRQRIVDDKGRGLKSITVPGSGHLRTAGVGGQTIPHAEYHNVTKLKAISEKIDQVVKPQNILIMKIDVQGLESAVLKGSKVLLLDGNVQVRMLVT